MRVRNEHITHPDESLRFLRFEVPRFAAPLHRHHHLELTWIERGQGIRYVGDDARPFVADDLVLIGAGVPHCWISPRRADSCAASVVQFEERLLDRRRVVETGALTALAEQARRGIAIGGEAAVKIRALLTAMRTAGPLGRVGLLYQALDALVRDDAARSLLTSYPPRAFSEAPRPAAIDRVVEWIHRHHASPLRVEDGARIAHVSRGAFSRFFHREFGKPFVEYVNDVRCAAASLRLMSDQRSIAQVARDGGFPTLSNFHAQFRRRMGCSPRQFRRLHLDRNR